jgi:DNA (cytosine-5)-methyltransferase 1
LGIKVFDVCSGIGGFSLGLEATNGFETVAFCEIDNFCRKVLNKHWPTIPVYGDLKELAYEPKKIKEEFDLICGGIPCQPFSLAGEQKGKEDDRHLWPFMFEIIKQKKPTWVIVENVGGFVNVALDNVCLDLETEGYSTQSFIIPASAVQAPHRRDRIWIVAKRDVANTDSSHSERRSLSSRVQEENTNTCSRSTNENVANTSSFRQQRQGSFGKWCGAETFGKRETNNAFSVGFDYQWCIEPRVGRVADGVSNRMDRLKGLGNAVVPQVVFNIGLAILGSK